MTQNAQTEWKPTYNFFYGDLKKVKSRYALKKAVPGWWLTYQWAGQDTRTTLPVGTLVDVWYSEKQNEYIVVREEVKNVAFAKNVTVQFVHHKNS